MNSHQRRVARRKHNRLALARQAWADEMRGHVRGALFDLLGFDSSVPVLKSAADVRASLGHGQIADATVFLLEAPPELPSISAALDAAFERDALAMFEAVRVPMPDATGEIDRAATQHIELRFASGRRTRVAVSDCAVDAEKALVLPVLGPEFDGDDVVEAVGIVEHAGLAAGEKAT